MSTMAYQLPTWSWPYAPTKFVDPSSESSRGLIERLQAHLQPYLAQATNPAATESGETVASAASVGMMQPMGYSQKPLAVRECVPIKHRGRQIVTAVRTIDNELNLLSWRVNADGSVACTGSSGAQSGSASQLDIAKARQFVVAYRTGARRLKLSSWDVSNTGAIYPAGESSEQDERIRKVKVEALTDHLLVTACITQRRQLKLITWQLGQDDRLLRLADSGRQGELVRDVVLVVLPGADDRHRLAVVVRSLSGQVKLLLWTISATGVISGGQSLAELDGVVTHLDAICGPEQQIIVSLRTLQGQLRLVGWRLQPDGNAQQPLFDTDDGGESIRHQALLHSNRGILVAFCTDDRKVKLAAWDIDHEGLLTHHRQSVPLSAAAGPIMVCPELLDGNAPILTGIRTTQGRLTLTTWRA